MRRCFILRPRAIPRHCLENFLVTCPKDFCQIWKPCFSRFCLPFSIYLSEAIGPSARFPPHTHTPLPPLPLPLPLPSYRRPSAIPAGSAPASGGSSCGDCRGGCRGDGFVIPLDVRRRGKVRALAHSLVTDVVEAVLRRCVLETATPLPIPTTKAATGFKRTADMALSKEAADATIAAVAAKTPTVTPSADATIAAVAVKTPTVKPSAAAPCSVIPAAAFKRAALSATVKPGAVELLPTCPWPSPAESMPPLLWKIPAATGVQGARGAVNAGAIAKTRLQSPSSPVLVAAVASPSSAANAGGDSTSSPSVLRSPPRLRGGARLSRRWEARTVRGASGRELTAANDADERMSWSSFDSLDVRVDDQVSALGSRLHASKSPPPPSPQQNT